MTPKTARRYINELLRDGIIGVLQQAVLFGFLSAWEVDIKEWECLNLHSAQGLAIVLDQRKRIAELEADRERLEKAVRKYLDSHTMAGANVEGELLSDYAVRLARERADVEDALTPPGPKEAGKEKEI